MAKAKEKTSRFQPRAPVMGCRKRPPVWRMPMERVTLVAPQANTWTVERGLSEARMVGIVANPG